MIRAKTIFTISYLSLSVVLFSCGKEKSTESTKDSDKPEVAEKPSPLFNGRDLTGWKIVGGNGQYKVEDGCIVGSGEDIKANTFLRTEKTYTDFELTYEFKFDTLKGNSGVMFRAQQKPSTDNNGRVFGYQCEGDNTKRSWSAGLYDEARRGWLYPTQDKSKEATTFADKFTKQGNEIFKWDDWNTITIRCQGNNIQTWLNGEKRVDFIDKDEKNDTREGFFGLQVHAGKSFQARWRNIVIKELN
jgi:hypothetical protein